MYRCELVDVATGKRYVRRDRRRGSVHRPGARSATRRRQRRLTRSGQRGMRAVAVTVKPAWIGPLLALFGGLGLFSVLYTYADHIDALMFAMVCLGTILLGACATGVREPPPRRP